MRPRRRQRVGADLAGLVVVLALGLLTRWWAAPAEVPPTPGPGTAETGGEAPADDVAMVRWAPLDPAQRAAARRRIGALPTGPPGSATGYRRAEFGQAWTDDAGSVAGSHNGCGTRDDVLARDLSDLRRRGRCVVVEGAFTDPYGGGAERFTKERAGGYPVDHVVPLAYAWAHGARDWPERRRVAFANDPLNLVVTTLEANKAKGASGPARWLPPREEMRCTYADRWARVATAYGLALPPEDVAALAAQCAG